MRAMDCSDPAHGDMHFAAASDEELRSKVTAHVAEHHPDVTEQQVDDLILQTAYDE